jgi:hypothetical protein
MRQERRDTGDRGAGQAADDLGGVGGQRQGRLLVCDVPGRTECRSVRRHARTVDDTPSRPLSLVLDNLAPRQGEGGERICRQQTGELEVHYLPGYSPELNPEDLVWNYMTRTGTARRPLGKRGTLQDNIEADMLEIQRYPGFAKSFFRAPYVAHITD